MGNNEDVTADAPAGLGGTRIALVLNYEIRQTSPSISAPVQFWLQAKGLSGCVSRLFKQGHCGP